MRVRVRCPLLVAFVLPWLGVGLQAQSTPLAPWLDVPVTWIRSGTPERVEVVPADLARGRTFRLTVLPPIRSEETIAAAYERTIGELGEWRPVFPPSDQGFGNGWQFRYGVGVLRSGGETYTALVAVAGNAGWVARFWAIADSDDTYNQYQGAMMTGVSSVQDLSVSDGPRQGPDVPLIATDAPAQEPGGATPPASGPRTTPGPTRTTGLVLIAPGYGEFGKGITGAYLGLERGLRASAGSGGMELLLDLTNNFLSVGADPGAPQLQTSLEDYPEVDLFLPDHRYRRGLPIRGLRSDLEWDQSQQPSRWGRWDLEGGRVVTRRGSYVTSYGVGEGVLLSERDRPWRRMPPEAELRLEGTFARADFRDADAPRLILREDGTYEDRGGFLRMVGSPWHLVVPDGDAMMGQWSEAEAARARGPGRGTYAFSYFTLTLQDVDGRVWQINAYVPPTETLPRARYLVVNGRLLMRD
ncbi:MAG: hypothetical protein R3E10_11960 [Gemmatimonadota bacterium]